MPLLADAHISSLGYLWGTQQSILREGSAPRSNPYPFSSPEPLGLICNDGLWGREWPLTLFLPFLREEVPHFPSLKCDEPQNQNVFSTFSQPLDAYLLALLGLFTTEMTYFPTLPCTSTFEIPTPSYTWNLKKVPLSGGAFPYKLLEGVPPGERVLAGSTPVTPSLTFCIKWNTGLILCGPIHVVLMPIYSWVRPISRSSLNDKNLLPYPLVYHYCLNLTLIVEYGIPFHSSYNVFQNFGGSQVSFSHPISIRMPWA